MKMHRAAFDRGMRSVTHTFNCMSSARRRGVYRVAGLLEFALSEPEISCELIADGHHVSSTLMKMLYRAKGAHGICLVTDATPGAGLPEGSRFALFGKECIVENGVCLLADHSALAGSAARMINLVRMMVREVNVPLNEAIAMATENPARAIGLETKGRLDRRSGRRFGCAVAAVGCGANVPQRRTNLVSLTPWLQPGVCLRCGAQAVLTASLFD